MCRHARPGSLGGMRSLRDERGQATTEYVALVALLALLLAAGAGVTAIGAPGVANAVLGQFRRALCLVVGGDCPIAPRAPCTVASTRDARHGALYLGIVRLDDDTVVLRERLSDGTIRLTLAQRDGGGVESGVGGEVQVDLGGHEVAVEREARGGVEGVLGHGEVFYARSEREADALLEAHLRGAGPRASEVFYEGGVRGLGRVVAAGGLQELSGQLDGMASAMLGARRDRRTGQVTLSVGAGASGSGLVSLLVGGGAGALEGQTVLGLTLDRHGRPAELSLSATGRVAAGTSLPSGIADALAQVLPNTTSASTGGRRWELAARADLRDPAVAAAWRAFRSSPTSTAAIRALGAALHSHATVDVRTYALESATSGIGAAVALGVRLGGEYERATDHAKLLAAARRPPFGVWEARVDCVAV
ncbi:MAG: hypothetical protein QOD69_3593 [Solirubrobacteraceae bacterium]|nr:hypothetical protein [Solirubrobacteraceae bacterium]